MSPQTSTRSAIIIVNPAARRAARFHPADALDFLEDHGIRASCVVAEKLGDTRRLAAQAAERGLDLAFVVGGDGTLRQAAGALAGSTTALAALPGGTANVWTKEVGIGHRMDKALRAHITGQTVLVDLGRANGEPFLMLAGAGWDARIAAGVMTGPKQLLGEFAYLGEAVKTLPYLHPQEIDWSIDGERRQDSIAVVVVSNTRLYGGRVQFAPKASAVDGTFHVSALAPNKRGDGLRLALLLVGGRLSGRRGVVARTARRIVIHTPGIPYQLDGDPAGESPVTFEIQPACVWVSVPAGPLAPTLMASE